MKDKISLGIVDEKENELQEMGEEETETEDEELDPPPLHKTEDIAELIVIEEEVDSLPPPPPPPPIAQLVLQPNRRHGTHPKSFACGKFYINYRSDGGKSYLCRYDAWTTRCPVHEGCSKSIQVRVWMDLFWVIG